MRLYLPIFVLAVLAAGFAAFSVIMGTVAGPKRWNRAKLESYECGIEPTPTPPHGGKIPVKYYLTAMLFIVFDIEIISCIPGRSPSTSSAPSAWSRWSFSSSLCWSRTSMSGGAAAWNGISHGS